MPISEPLRFTHRGRELVVSNDRYPRDKLWVFVDGRDRAYLGQLTEGMTRREVKELARRWFDEHNT